jgi:glycosyltransferase involved in cell wall biosynthesis
MAQCEGDTCERFAPRVGLPVPVSKESGQARLRQRRAVSAPAADQAQPRPAQAVRAVVTAGAAALPMVSCIMPTYDRRRFEPLAISFFLRQDYTKAQLVIVAHGTDPVGDLVPNHPAIRYHRLDNRMVLGAKRNLAWDQALGEIIVHWDDDDWPAPDRLLVEVNRLEVTGAEKRRMRSPRFYDPAKRLAWCYTWPCVRRPWAAGTSLCYRRGLWERSPYTEVAVGEDTRFVWRAVGGPIADVNDTDCVIALIHDRDTVPKTGRGAYWSGDWVIEVERVLGADVTLYHTGYQRPEGRHETKERCDVTG